MRFAAVIAAAGLSSRMHEFKPMLCVGQNTMIGMVIRNLREAGVAEIVVVVGYKADILRRYLASMDVTVCENPAYAETKMFFSLCLGIRALNGAYDGVLLTPGDVPSVRPETIRALMEKDSPIVRPVHGNALGHPVLVRKECVAGILDYCGEGGLLGAVEAQGVPVLNVEVDDAGVLMDADTPEDLKALRRRELELRRGGKLWHNVRACVVKGDMEFTPETAQMIEMVAHTGSIQNACACMHMSYSAGWKRLNELEQKLGFYLVDRLHGGASGGGSVLTEKGAAFLRAYQQYEERLRQAADALFEEAFPEELRE